MVQPLSRGGKPRSIAVLHPVPWPQQNDASGLHEEHAKVAIAALGDTPEDGSITCGYLLGDQTEPSSKIAAACEGSSIADRGDDGARDDRAYARYCHQVPTGFRVLGERIDFPTHSLDAIVEAASVLTIRGDRTYVRWARMSGNAWRNQWSRCLTVMPCFRRKQRI
jgi:hypothetical protein